MGDPASRAAEDINRLMDRTLTEAEQILSQIPVRQRQTSDQVQVRHRDTAPTTERAAAFCREEILTDSATSEHRVVHECHKLHEMTDGPPTELKVVDSVELLHSRIRQADDHSVPDFLRSPAPSARPIEATVSRDQIVDAPGLGPVPLRPVDSLELAKVRRLDEEKPDIPEFLHSPAPDKLQLTKPGTKQTVATQTPTMQSPGQKQVQSPQQQVNVPQQLSKPIPVRTMSPMKPEPRRVWQPISDQQTPTAPKSLPIRARSPIVTTARTISPVAPRLSPQPIKTQQVEQSAERGVFPPISSTEGVKVAPESVDLRRTFGSEPRDMPPSTLVFTRDGQQAMSEDGRPLQFIDQNGQPLPPVPGGYLINDDGTPATDSQGHPLSVQSATPAVQSTERVTTEPDRVWLERSLVSGPVLPQSGVYLADQDGYPVRDQGGANVLAQDEDGDPLRWCRRGVMVDPATGAVVQDQQNLPIPGFDTQGNAYTPDKSGYLVDSDGNPLLDTNGNKVPASNDQNQPLHPEQCFANKRGQLFLDTCRKPLVAIFKDGSRVSPSVVSTEKILVQPEKAQLHRAFSAEVPRSAGQVILSQERTAVSPSSVSMQRSFNIGPAASSDQNFRSPAKVSVSAAGRAPVRFSSQTTSHDTSTARMTSERSPVKIIQQQMPEAQRVPSGEKLWRRRAATRDVAQVPPSSESSKPRSGSGSSLGDRSSASESGARSRSSATSVSATSPSATQVCPVCGSGEFTVDLKIRVHPGELDERTGRRQGRAEVNATCTGVTPVDVFIGKDNVWHDAKL